MQLRFTAAGKNIFDTNPTAFTVTRLVLTDAFGYTIAPVPSALQGDIVYDETAELSIGIDNTNTLRFTKLLDNTIGSFEFGEAGLYSGATLVAVGVNPTPIQKVATVGANNGNYLTLNFFLTYNNADSYGFVKLGNSDSRYQLGQVQHLDYLEPPFEGDPNAYVVNGLTPSDVPDFAFVDFFGRWNFAAKPQRYYSGEVTTATDLAVDIATAHGVVFATPTDYIIQFISGRLRGYCRELINIGDTFFQWNTPTLLTPESGDQFLIVGPRLASITLAGQANIQFQNEGANLGSAGSVNEFDVVGPNVTASRAGNKVTLNVGTPTIPSAIVFQEEGVSLGTPGTVDTVNIVGDNVTATRSGNVVTIEVDTFPSGGGQLPIQFRDEGDNLGAPGDVGFINFVGDAVDATLVSDTLTVTVNSSGLRVQSYTGIGIGSGTFGGTAYSTWSITPAYTAPASPLVSLGGVGNDVFTFLETGTYRVTFHATLDGGELFPDLLTGYGIELNLNGGASTTNRVPSAHSRFSAAATPGDNADHNLGPWVDGALVVTWSDTFILQTGPGGTFRPAFLAYNADYDTFSYVPSFTVVIEKLSNAAA